eukprot:TRINITY_DN3386_c0_g2_i1.p1 TRINITY_DN3386_c0_g2~~TRINITY_DN3386_c0_g2_i1.p1  ORF type:complete len:135 (-),score=12.32 TRINITY_DN3386_c0_g2_i1:111-515(-)
MCIRDRSMDLLIYLFLTLSPIHAGILVGPPGFIFCCLTMKFLYSDTRRCLVVIYIILRATFWGIVAFFFWNIKRIFSADGYVFLFSSVNFIASICLLPRSKEIKPNKEVANEQELPSSQKKLLASEGINEVNSV